MNSVAIYEIRCPNRHTTELPETILEEIIRHLRESYKGEPVLNFVCSECKTAFHFDYQKMEPVGWTDAPRQISEFHGVTYPDECDGANCEERVVLTAVRSCDKDWQSILLETIAWDVSGITCRHGHPAHPVGALKHSQIRPLGTG